MLGGVAIASARTAYQIFKETLNTGRFMKLAAKGARAQRLLWASTGVKNPAYPDVKYVEALIGPDTVDTIPLDTLNAYRDHGDPKPRIEQDFEDARRMLDHLPELGINIDEQTQRLENDGVDKFSKPFDKLMETISQRASPRTAAV
jgi:transaldolase